MNRREMVLAGLAAADGADHRPVQVQKLFFLIDREAAAIFDGPHFSFKPYDYGPFDREVYVELDKLENDGLVQTKYGNELRYRKYLLTPEGQRSGDEVLSSVSSTTREWLVLLSAWVRQQSFAQLVSAIYRNYPDMKAHSVFRG